MNELTVGSLFSGIGGFDLGFQRAGMRTVWFCEQDEFCRRVLAKHWPGVPCHPDVRALVADARGAGRRQDLRGAHGDEGSDAGRRTETADLSGGRSEGPGGREVLPVPVPYVDVLCGGFPCQDISLAGKGAGIDGARSGLWREYARLVGELRPRYVVVENVPALTSRGLDRVLADLAPCGFDAEWDHIPASAVGAPHRRDRLWLVAYPQSAGLEGLGADAGEPQEPESGHGRALGDPEGNGRGSRRQGRSVAAGAGQPEPERTFQMADPARDVQAGTTAGAVGKRARAGGQRSGAYPDADGGGRQEREERDGRQDGPGLEAPFGDDADGFRDDVADAEGNPVGTRLREGEPGGERWGRSGDGRGEGATGKLEPGLGRAPDGVSEWLDGSWERGISRVAVGVPGRNDRLRALGNALVPQIAEWIGRRLIEWESANDAEAA